jgi:hypothetical protein
MFTMIMFPNRYLLALTLTIAVITPISATDWDVVKTPLKWTDKGIEIILEDQLKVKEMPWPKTLLEYDVDFSAYPVEQNELALTDVNSGQPVPFQLADIQTEYGRLKSATLCFFSDLPSGMRRNFRLQKISPEIKKENKPVVSVKSLNQRILIENGLVRLELPGTGVHKELLPPIIQIGDNNSWLGSSIMPDKIGFISMKVEEISVGDLFAEYLLSYQFEKGKQFQIKIRLVADNDFVILEENMAGFIEADSLAWEIKWNNFHPEFRYCNNRPGIEHKIDVNKTGYDNFRWEPISGYPENPKATNHPDFTRDQNNLPNGLLPFNLTPYMSSNWWRLHTAAFWNSKTGTTVGLFVKDFENWIDPEYPVYSSRPNLSVSYYFLDDKFWWSLPLVTGKRSLALAVYPHQKDIDLVNETNLPFLHIDDLRRWYGWISLNKIKNWILDYEPCKPITPRCFEPYVRQADYNSLYTLLWKKIMFVRYYTERDSYSGHPVDVRNLYEYFFYEFAETKLTTEEFRQLRAMFLFMTYIYMDEAVMPTKTLLSGHADFLTDIKGVSGLAAFLFPDHPYAGEMADNFEKSFALNLQYHTRPTIPVWDSKGGRWTENLACYVWESFKNSTRTSFLLHYFYDGKNRLLQPNISLIANWLMNSLAAPLDIENGKRAMPPQGAHHRVDVPPRQLYFLGEGLRYYDPILSEHIMWMASPDNPPFEASPDNPIELLMKSKQWRNGGTNPNLKSEKFTGYGYILRSGFGTPGEMYVHLQQIDQGLNARWGQAAKGGNGIIYYYADGKRYSHNEGYEDVGDIAYGDVERCTNFGVKKNEQCYRCIGDYRSVGRNDLTDPLYDFGFAQFASVNANSEASPEYKSRSVLMSGNDYILIFDDLRDDSVEGRFSWFVGRTDSFPYIYQLIPNVKPELINPSPPDLVKTYQNTDVLFSKGRYYDGKGDFLTLVTHKKEVQTFLRDDICEVKRNEAIDLVFRSDKLISYSQSGDVFEGTAGIIRHDKVKNEYEAALFIGNKLGIPGICAEWKQKPAFGGFSIKKNAIGYIGFIQVTGSASLEFTVEGKLDKDFSFYLNELPMPIKITGKKSFIVDLKRGKYTWQWTDVGIIPSAPVIVNAFTGESWSDVEWHPVTGAQDYSVQMSTDGEITWIDVEQGIKSTHYKLTGLTDGKKLHVRVIARAKGGQGNPSDSYPIYPTGVIPHAPEGLRAVTEGHKVSLIWGQILGTNQYTLYQRTQGASDYQKVYSGPETRTTIDLPDSLKVYEFCVTATNGIGESEKSVSADTDENRIINWYPVPGETYRRVTESYEQGYPIYNNWIEQAMPVLKYPVGSGK